MIWRCQCGNEMRDGSYPCPDGYEVYSEAEWDEIGNLCDEDGKIKYNKIPESKMRVFVCPECGRIIVFKVGADGMLEKRGKSYVPESD